MICQTHPWAHHETGWSAALAAQSESLLSLSNGYLGIRGTLDEGAPAALPGTYLSGFFERVPIPYADRGYGDPEANQVLVGAPDGTRIRAVIESEPLDIQTGAVLEHDRVLDLRAGLLSRSLRWRSPSGRELALRSHRLVSLVHREVAAIEYELRVTEPATVEVSSELIATHAGRTSAVDPRAGTALPHDALAAVLASHDATGALLGCRARESGHVVVAGMEHLVLDAPSHEARTDADDGVARCALRATLEPGVPLRLVKLLAYHWAPDGDPEALAVATRQSLQEARSLGFDALAGRQAAALHEAWERADIELDGDPEIQHALRYALFQLHQNTACADGHAIPAKGLTGPGYDGHTFWDTETFLLPALSYCAPHHVEAALRWRASTLPRARAKARRLGLRGAAFPWRTIDGEECSGYLPAGTAAFHINADIAHAAVRHVAATGDERFEREAAAPLLVETARLWVSLGYHDERRGGRFSIDGVTGPDEYSVLVDNNLYTNLMARANLRAAADVVDRLGADALEVREDEVTAWRRAADLMTIPYDSDLAIHLQDEEFARHAPFDFDEITPDQYPLLLHVPYFQLYRSQVIKQPDLVLAMALCGEAFTPAEKLRNFSYYEPLTVRDSSLSAGTQAVIAAEVGDTQLAYDYLAEAALLDHHDLARNTADGLHLAALAGGRTAVIEGLAGVRRHGGLLSFRPRLPDALSRVAFPFRFRGRWLHVEIASDEVTYRLRSGRPLEVRHWDAPLNLHADGSVVARIPPPAPPPAIRQPRGRAPARRTPPPAARDRPAPAAR